VPNLGGKTAVGVPSLHLIINKISYIYTFAIIRGSCFMCINSIRCYNELLDE